MSLQPDDPRHGTPTGYNRHDCRCEPCRGAYRPIGRGYMKPKQDATLDSAGKRRWSEWTQEEIEFLTTSELPLVEVAQQIGRTYYSVARMRNRLKQATKAEDEAGC